MRLDQTLVVRGLCESRTEAQEIIESGNVLVNGSVSTKQTKQVEEKDVIEVTARRKYVSRGGEKLEGVLKDVVSSGQWAVSSDSDAEKIRALVQGKYALDIGSSTGGFTDCLLSYGVAHVDAADVGTMQLHEKLRNHSHITLYENTDIREFKSTTNYGIIVADLSFIPLHNVFEQIIRLGSAGTNYFLLIKPQFEVGRGNTKKGIVKDKEIIQKVLSEYESLGEKFGLKAVQIVPCRIQGGDGNQEFFLYGKK